jgi:hypothetical protein
MSLKSILLLIAVAVLVVACGNDVRQFPAAPVGVIGGGCTNDVDCAYLSGVCLTDLPGGYCTVDCSSLGCPTDSACAQFGSDEVCAFVCSADTDCRNGYFCDVPDDAETGICDAIDTTSPPADVGLDVPISDSGTDAPSDTIEPSEANYGAACEAASECTAASGLPPRCLSDAQGFSGGYCSATCAQGIDECGGNAVCLDSSVGGLCVIQCEVASECRSAYECCSVEASAACLPAGLAGQCLPPDEEPGTGERELGEACESDEDCGAGAEPACFTQIPGGYCTSDCDSDEDCGAGVCANLGGVSLCLAPCGEDGACGGELVCCDVGFGDACLPDVACL